MKKLLLKDLHLALHPTVLLFLLLSVMLMIPSYPYYVIFFYTCLGIFFVCLTGRENHDIEYTLTLPVRKKDVVRSRILFSVIIQLMQMLLCVPFAYLRQTLIPMRNDVGMDANIALFGLSFLLLGVFNFDFFTRYYRAPDKVGKAFAISSILYFVLVIVLIVCDHALPFFRDTLDTLDPENLTPKLCVLVAGAAVYALLTLFAAKQAERTFSALDL